MDQTEQAAMDKVSAQAVLLNLITSSLRDAEHIDSGLGAESNATAALRGMAAKTRDDLVDLLAAMVPPAPAT